MTTPHIDGGIDLGQIITVIVFVMGIIGAHYTLKGTLRVLVARFDDFKRSVEGTTVGINQRLDKHEAVIQEVSGKVHRLVGTVESMTRPRGPQP